ncbi:hypothetical protein Y032_0535g3095 [Ancylostoma ceylanicum]|nr:hypothetical protein Y032_0535g3095 [Ancylostoma ceylanicum]
MISNGVFLAYFVNMGSSVDVNALNAFTLCLVDDVNDPRLDGFAYVFFVSLAISLGSLVYIVNYYMCRENPQDAKKSAPQEKGGKESRKEK